MKRMTALLMAALLCLCLTGCGKAPEPEQSPQEPPTEATDPEEAEELPQSGSAAPGGDGAEEPARQGIELIGPWHLDRDKNDLAAFADRFPGYAEWGAGMEIRSDGLMSWHIGAEGWHGNYVTEQETLHGELGSDLEQLVLPWDFRMVTENETVLLEMDHGDITVYWVYGEQEDVPPMGGNTKVYVDRQGTDDIYSSLFITQSGNDYEIEMEIYRLASFRGTAVKTQGMLFYTDDCRGIKGTIQYDSDHAVFEVTESTSDLAETGTTWVFPELQEDFSD